MAAPGLVVAYHGCDVTTCERLLAGKTRLRPSGNHYDWLGDGVYFFEGDWLRAYRFASMVRDRRSANLTTQRIHAPAVVGAILRVSHWLDMSTQKGIAEFERAYASLLAEGAPLEENRRARDDDADFMLRSLDRQVFNELHRRREHAGMPAYDAVRGPFVEGEPVVRASGIRSDTHLQIALRNDACVLGYFRVLDLMAEEARTAAMIEMWRRR